MSFGVGVVGLGVMGADHAGTLHRAVAGAQLRAVADPDGARARRVADATPGCRVLDDPLDLIGDEGVDGVVVASPDATHEALVLACLRAGKPVLCEKPLAPSPQGCLRIVAAEAAAGRRLVQVGFMRRYDPAYRQLKARLDAGAIGAVVLMHCVHRNVSTPPTYTSEMLVTSSASHELDACRWLLGQEVRRVTVRFPRRSALAPQGLRDPQLIVLETDAGVLVTIEVFVNARYGYEVGCECVGETGTLALPPPAATVTRHDAAVSRSLPLDWRERFADAYREELQAWVSGAARGTPDGPSAWDGYVASAVAEACLAAMDSGAPAPVRLAERPALYG
jgi:myo-inositol 2-dehydrogenase / D-chiro-inositol 1-dehydrogenase